VTHPRIIPAIIVVSVVAVFGRLCTCEFTWYDDSATVHQNPSFNPPTCSKVMSYWNRFGPDAPMGLYVPLTYTVWGALAAVAYSPTAGSDGMHLNPWVFHTANVLLHAVNALLVFVLLRRLVAGLGRRGWARCCSHCILCRWNRWDGFREQKTFCAQR
jgi:hypothetical protein